MSDIKVLYVEDEPMLGKIVEETLSSRGFSVRRLVDGRNWKQEIQDLKPDICVFDIMLPFIDGFELGKLVRTDYPDLPIIFLTAKVQTQDVVKGFHSGGNDYLKKPFSMEELIVRMENLLPKGGAPTPANETPEISFGQFTFHRHRYELTHGTEVHRLSHKEAQLLIMLCDNVNQQVERKDILLKVWGDDSYFNSRNLDVYVTKLRKYLRPDPSIEIKTLKGIGYFFRVN